MIKKREKNKGIIFNFAKGEGLQVGKISEKYLESKEENSSKFFNSYDVNTAESILSSKIQSESLTEDFEFLRT